MSSSSNGIYNYSTGSVTIGTKDGIVNTTNPDITGGGSSGSRYGVYNRSSGPIYFYDGILKGSRKSVYGTITAIEDNTDYSADITTATEVYLVEQSGNQAKIGDIEYATLQEAIDNANAGDTIQLLKGIPFFSNSEPITISKGQEIVIDMAGHNMVSALENVTIQNSGTLTLQNTSDSSTTIQAVSSNVIVNNAGGTLTLNNITILESTGNSLQNAGTVEIQDSILDIIENTNGTVNIHSGTVEYIINNDGNVVQNGGIIHSIENNGGDVRILAGTAENITSTGTVTVGTKDGNVAIDSPVIIGTNIDNNQIYYGIENNGGQVYFYDGIIKGGPAGIKGTFTELETNTELLVGEETIDDEQYEVLTLQSVDGPAASIDGTTYETLQDAIDACADNTPTTITVLRNTVVSSAEIANTKNIILDVNGKVVTQYQPLINYGTLKIVDNSGLDTGNITSYQSSAIQNAGTLEIAGGKIGNNAIGIQNTGTCHVSGGMIDGNSIGISNESTGTLTVVGGTISNNTQGIAQKGTGTTTVTSGTFDTNTSGTYATDGTIVIENATFTGNTYANHVNGADARITVANGNFTNNQHGMYVQSGQGFSGIKDTVVGVTPNIVGTVSGIKVDSGATLHLYDGTIQGTESAIAGYATYLEDGYKVQSSTVDGLYTDTLALAGTVQTVARVDDIEFSSVQAAINSCIGDTAKTVTLLNTVTVNESLRIDSDLKVILDLNKHNIEGNFAGSIIDNSGELTIIDSSTEKTGKIINTGGQGIYNTGTLTIGTDDGTIEETVRVEGSTTGLQTTGTFNYYDGLLAGTTVIDGTVNSLPSGSVIRTRTENGLTVYYID